MPDFTVNYFKLETLLKITDGINLIPSSQIIRNYFTKFRELLLGGLHNLHN